MAMLPCTEEAMAYLCRRDKRLAAVIRTIGPVQRASWPDLFCALISSIVGQQLSGKAADTIWGRVEALCGGVTPSALLEQEEAALRGCGLSGRKATYVRTVAAEVASGRLDLAALDALPDEAVCTRLTELPGIGRWTAEMVLLFAMQRPDVFSFGDLAIHRGLRMIYRHRHIDRERFERYRRRYAPYGSLASLYLWAVAGGACGLSDPAERKPNSRQA